MNSTPNIYNPANYITSPRLEDLLLSLNSSERTEQHAICSNCNDTFIRGRSENLNDRSYNYCLNCAEDIIPSFNRESISSRPNQVIRRSVGELDLTQNSEIINEDTNQEEGDSELPNTMQLIPTPTSPPLLRRQTTGIYLHNHVDSEGRTAIELLNTPLSSFGSYERSPSPTNMAVDTSDDEGIQLRFDDEHDDIYDTDESDDTINEDDLYDD